MITHNGQVYLDRREASEFLGLTLHSLNRMAYLKRGPKCVHIGRKSWYRQSELEYYKRDFHYSRRAEADSKSLEEAFAESDQNTEQLGPKLKAVETMLEQFKPKYVPNFHGIETWAVGLYACPTGLYLKRA